MANEGEVLDGKLSAAIGKTIDRIIAERTARIVVSLGVTIIVGIMSLFTTMVYKIGTDMLAELQEMGRHLAMIDANISNIQQNDLQRDHRIEKLEDRLNGDGKDRR